MTDRLPRRLRKKIDIDPTRIGQLLRLALSSDQAGEIVAATERGLRPAPPPRGQSWSPPSPNLCHWQSMAWYLHHHRHHLLSHQREWIEDLLLGRGDGFDDGRVRNWVVEELGRLVAGLRNAA